MSVNIIILGAQRSGKIDPLAAARNVTHKCVISVAGAPLISHILNTVSAHEAVNKITISIEETMFEDIAAITSGLGSKPITCTAAKDNLADSVIAAMHALGDSPTIITTADNALMRPSALQAMIDALQGGSDVAIGLATESAVQAAHRYEQKGFYKFADDKYSNCNLFGLSGLHALQAVELFRGGGQFARNSDRIIDAFGLVNLLLLKSGVISLSTGMKRISKRIGLNVQPVVLTDGRNAIDVDNEESFEIVSEMLAKEAA